MVFNGNLLFFRGISSSARLLLKGCKLQISILWFKNAQFLTGLANLQTSGASSGVGGWNWHCLGLYTRVSLVLKPWNMYCKRPTFVFSRFKELLNCLATLGVWDTHTYTLKAILLWCLSDFVFDTQKELHLQKMVLIITRISDTSCPRIPVEKWRWEVVGMCFMSSLLTSDSTQLKPATCISWAKQKSSQHTDTLETNSKFALEDRKKPKSKQ